MIKKDLSKQDRKDWKEFLENTTSVPNKDTINKENHKKIKRFKFDLHGYSIESANKKISEIIENCYKKGILEILIITGKGIHSQSSSNVYLSEDLSKLKHSIPEFIKSNMDLNSKIVSISNADESSGGSGAYLIKLRKIIK